MADGARAPSARESVMAHTRGLLFSVPSRTGAMLVVIALSAIGASLSLTPPLTRRLELSTIGSSAGDYLEIAANLVWCGRYPYLTSTIPGNRRQVDLLEVAVATFGQQSIRQ